MEDWVARQCEGETPYVPARCRPLTAALRTLEPASRPHGTIWRHATEMCLAMYVPVVLLPLVWLEVIGAMTFMIAAHVVMMVVMLVVLVRQRGGRNG